MTLPAESDPTLAPRTQALLEFYKEQCEHGRHAESQRHGVTTMFLTSSGILLSVIGALEFSVQTLPLAICIVALGIFGRRFIRIFETKWEESSARRNHYRRLVQDSLEIPNAPAGSSKGILRTYWTNAFNAVVIVGVICIFVSLGVTWARATGAGQCNYGDPIIMQLAGCDFSKS